MSAQNDNSSTLDWAELGWAGLDWIDWDAIVLRNVFFGVFVIEVGNFMSLQACVQISIPFDAILFVLVLKVFGLLIRRFGFNTKLVMFGLQAGFILSFSLVCSIVLDI